MIAEPRIGSIAARARLVVLVAVLALGFGRAAQSVTPKVIDFVELSGYVDSPAAGYVERQIDAANRNGSEAMILRLDTRGFLGSSVKQMVQKMLASKVPMVVWVAPAGATARSGGFILVLAADVAVMSPGSTLGPGVPLNLANPRGSSGAQTVDSRGSRVDPGPLLATTAAASRGRNPQAAEAVFSGSDSLGPKRALDAGLIDFIAGSPKTLLDTLQGREKKTALGSSRVIETDRALVRFHKMSAWERILHSAISPEVAYFLVLLGFFGLVFELYHPGLGAAGLLGGAALILGLYALQTLPTSWIGVAAIALSMLAYLRDLQLGAFGGFTIAGTAGLIAGSLLLFRSAIPELRLSIWAIAAAVVITLLFFLSVMTAAIRARLARPAPGAGKLIGTSAMARSSIAPEGEVVANGTLWRARTAGAAIPEGATVTIRSVSGLVLIVEETEA